MDEERFGVITVNLLGNIAQALTSLRGIPVMAYELIQNAEDSGATTSVFNINEDGIEIKINSQFKKCVDREGLECKGLRNEVDRGCDWHNIRDIAGGQKALNETNAIGRFGIGFMSVYQVTDTPTISSDGLQMRFKPSNKLKPVIFSNSAVTNETVLFLPWASDQSSEARKRFTAVPAINAKNFNRYAEEISESADQALLFLTSLERIEVNRNGHRIHSVEVHDEDKNDKSTNVREIVLGPITKRQKWLIIREREIDKLLEIEKNNPIVASQKRKHDVAIAIPLSGVPLGPGRLYAYLPTEDIFQLPIRINGDFFPDPSRKRIIFDESSTDDGSVQWNNAIISAAAELLAKNIKALNNKLSTEMFWDLVGGAKQMSKRLADVGSNHPKSYREFWEWIQLEIKKHEIVSCEGNIKRKILDAVVIGEPNLNLKRQVLIDLGLTPISLQMKNYQKLLEGLGAPTLGLRLVIEAAKKCTWVLKVDKNKQVETDVIQHRYEPLWQVLNTIIPETEISEESTEIEELKDIPFFLSCNYQPANLRDFLLAERNSLVSLANKVLPRVDFLCTEIAQYKGIHSVSNIFDLIFIIKQLQDILSKGNINQTFLNDFYDLLTEASYFRAITTDEKDRLLALEIWPSSDARYISGSKAKIPGNFVDPLGIADLLDVQRINKSGMQLLEKTMDVARLNVENYVLDVLPLKFHGGSTSIDEKTYILLIRELSSHKKLVNTENTLHALQQLPLVPLESGEFVCAGNAVLPSVDGKSVFAVAFKGWMKKEYFSDDEDSGDFLRKIGVRDVPQFNEILRTWEFVTSEFSPLNGKKQITAITDYIYENQSKWTLNAIAQALEQSKFKELRRFPVINDPDLWHSAIDTYSPEWASTFATCHDALVWDSEKITSQKLNWLTNIFGVKSEPEISLVIRHIRNLQASAEPPDKKVYKILNKLLRSDAIEDDKNRVRELRDESWIYLEDRYFKPSRLFLKPVVLGKRVFQLDSGWAENYKNLVEVLQIPDYPGSNDVLSVLREIAQEDLTGVTTLDLERREEYIQVLLYLSSLNHQDRIDEEVLRSLREEELFLTEASTWISIDKGFVPDSDWFVSRFENEFNDFIFSQTNDLEHILFEQINFKRYSKKNLNYTIK